MYFNKIKTKQIYFLPFLKWFKNPSAQIGPLALLDH